MPKKAFYLFLISSFFLSCQTIHYTNKSPVPPETYKYSNWHHIGVFGLVEFSDPARPDLLCGEKEWEAVRTQTGILQILTNLAISSGLQAAQYTFFPKEALVGAPGAPQLLSLLQAMYSPEEVSTACSPL